MNIIVTKAAASLVVISVILSPPVFAKALDDAVSQAYFNDSLQRCNALLSQWEGAWRIAVGLAVLVVILGAVSAVIQGIQARSVRIATAICGLFITIVTGLTNTVGWDHRELNRSITKGQTMIAQMNRPEGLVQQLSTLFGPEGLEVPTIFAHAGHFAADSQQVQETLGVLVQQLAPAAADFPAVSTVPGLTFRYHPELRAFERSSGSLGPVYVERPQTIGRGKLDIGFSYLFQSFDELDGDSVEGLSFNLSHTDCCGPAGDPGSILDGLGPFPDGELGASPDTIFERDTADIFFDEFDIESHVLSLFATYGITDRWDVNVLVPIIFTSLKVSARAVLNNEFSSRFLGGPIHFFDIEDRTTVNTFRIDDDSTGVGDLLLRTKYHFLSSNSFNLASGLTLRIPTGDEDDFQGLGDVVLTPYLTLSQEWSRFDFHFQAGFDVNADDIERSRARYGIGLTTQLVERLAFLIDIIGSSNLTEQDISVTVPVFGGTDVIGSRTITRGLRTDIVDLAVGFKAAFAQSVVGFAAVFLPLNDDGLRSDAVPTAGLEVSF